MATNSDRGPVPGSPETLSVACGQRSHQRLEFAQPGISCVGRGAGGKVVCSDSKKHARAHDRARGPKPPQPCVAVGVRPVESVQVVDAKEEPPCRGRVFPRPLRTTILLPFGPDSPVCLSPIVVRIGEPQIPPACRQDASGCQRIRQRHRPGARRANGECQGKPANRSAMRGCHGRAAHSKARHHGYQMPDSDLRPVARHREEQEEKGGKQPVQRPGAPAPDDPARGSQPQHHQRQRRLEQQRHGVIPPPSPVAGQPQEVTRVSLRGVCQFPEHGSHKPAWKRPRDPSTKIATNPARTSASAGNPAPDLEAKQPSNR